MNSNPVFMCTSEPLYCSSSTKLTCLLSVAVHVLVFVIDLLLKSCRLYLSS